MKYILALSLFCIFLVLSFSQQQPVVSGNNSPLYKQAESYYLAAEKLPLKKNYSEEEEAELNRKALKIFLQLLPGLESGKQDSLLYLTQYRVASLHHYFENLPGARDHYLAAIKVKERNPALPDSLLFRPLVYTGSVYYSLHRFDSALYYYKRAETISEKYNRPLGDQQRLYNNMGLIHYETGNYKQAKNYFEKSLAMLPVSDPSYKDLKANYQNNIAAALLNLEQYDTAKAIYLQLLPTGYYRNFIKLNLGTIDLSLGNPASAIRWYKQVDTSSENSILLYNKMAKAFLEQNLADSAARYLSMAAAANLRQNGNTRNVASGLNALYRAELFLARKQLNSAVAAFQEAIIQFHNGFDQQDPAKNPETFSGIFPYIHLFNALTEKADALTLLNKQQKERRLLEMALDAYRAAFRLATYVERTYDSDEARLFLGKIKHQVHSKPIDISLQLYEQTGKISYLEESYHFDQLNKASILALNVQENELRYNNRHDHPLLEQEATLKKNITRIQLAASREKDSTRLRQLNDEIRDDEIELGKIQEKLADDPQWSLYEAGARIPTVSQLQRKMDNNSALLSYHLAANELLVLLITNRKFEYYRADIDATFFQRIDGFKKSLQNESAEQRYDGSNTAMALYQVLIKPLYASLKQCSRLVIIPDDELNYLPFEALQDENRKYLLEHFSVQYTFSTALFGEGRPALIRSGSLAFAPFTMNDMPADMPGDFFSILPASQEEVAGLKGKILLDSAATRKNFLHYANSYPILHLATHAKVNNDTPAHSFIAFYPDTREYKLYAGEISNLRLDSVQLVILSACETGAGQLVKGEGLMSLSRAFAYAGCPDIITSLWKAEDKTTSFITRRLHYYLEKRYSKDKALQLAKLDLLKSNETDPRFKTPDYWAHLIYIGNYEEDRGSRDWWWIALTIIGGAFLYKMIRRK